MKNNCPTCNFKDDEKFIILRTKYWKVALLDDQAYIGHCVVVLNNHKESLAELTDEEWVDFGELQRKLEPAIKKAFNSPLLNWGCMMNHDFRDVGFSHIHWHVLARLKKPIIINNQKFVDELFGWHYDHKKEQVVDEKTKEIIANILKNELK